MQEEIVPPQHSPRPPLPAAPLQMVQEQHKGYWRNILEKVAIRRVNKNDIFGVRLADMLSAYVSIAEKAFFATHDANPGMRGQMIQLPEIQQIMENEYHEFWRMAVGTRDRIYSFNIAAKTPILINDTDVYSQYQIDIAFIPAQYQDAYMALYAIRRVEQDTINASAIGMACYSTGRSQRSQLYASEMQEYAADAVAGGNCIDDELDGAGLFGLLHETFAASSRTIL